MTTPVQRITPPTDLGGARLECLHSEIKAHAQQAQQRYAAALENRAAFIEAHAAGKPSQYLKDLALMDFAMANIEQNAANLCYQQIEIVMLGGILECVNGDADDDSDEGFTLNPGAKPA